MAGSTGFAGCGLLDGGDEVDALDAPPSGLRIIELSLSPSVPGCFKTQLTYEIRPVQGTASFEVSYRWDHALYRVTGLADRKVPGRILASVEETFEVCPAHPSPEVQLFPLKIEARSPKDWFFGTFTASHVRGSEAWAASLLPELVSLASEIRTGSPSPELLRRYYRTRAAYTHGGLDAFEQAVDADIEGLLGELDLPLPARVVEAYRQILKENGGQVEVGFETDSSEVSYITLNPSFRLTGDPVMAAQAQLTSGQLADLLNLQPNDELRPTSVEQVPAGISVQLYRFRDRTPVLGDMVSAMLVKHGESYHLDSLEVSFGNLGEVTCPSVGDGASEPGPSPGPSPSPSPSIGAQGVISGMETPVSLVAAHAIPDATPFSDVSYRQVFLRQGLEYRCAHLWSATWTDPEGDGDYPYLRIVDASSGQVIHDDRIIMADGGDDAVHIVKTGLTIPYKKVNTGGLGSYFQDITTVPGGELHGFVPIPELGEDGNIYYRAVDEGSIVLPHAPDAPYIVPNGITLGRGHATFMFLPYWENDVPGMFHFLVQGLYEEKFDDLYSEELTPHLSTAQELLYKPTWTFQDQWDDPDAFCPDALKPGKLPVELDENGPLPDQTFPRHCANRLNRARAFVGQAYFYAQYGRYLWSHDEYGDPRWSGGPNPNDGSQRYVDLEVIERRRGETHACGRWNGYRKIYMYIDRRECDERDEPCFKNLECSIDRSVSTFPHEFGHWVGNVLALNHCQTSAGAAKVEAFADYISDSLNANWRSHRLKPRAGNYYLQEWQFLAGSGDEHRYHGNTLYAQLLDDHLFFEDGEDCLPWKQHSIKVNTINWSGMWLQYLNLVGGLFSDPTIRSALRRTANPPLSGISWHPRLDSSCSSKKGGLHCLTHAAHRVSGEMYHWESAHYAPANLLNSLVEVVVNRRDVEIQRASKQHDWHRYLNKKAARRQTHKVSQAPGHAHSLTLTENGPAVVNVRFDKQFHTKWVSFFAHSGVTYKLNAISKTAPIIRLFDVVEEDNHGERSTGLLQLASSDGCPHSVQSFNSNLIPILLLANNGNCESPPAQSESMVTFAPRRSGWLYASITSKVAAGGVIKLATADGNLQITNTSRHQGHPAFDREGELRLGQVVPITIEHQPDPAKTVTLDRYGRFVNPVEEHFWKIQPAAFHLVPGVDPIEPWHRWSEQPPNPDRPASIVLQDNTKKSFYIVVERLSTDSTFELDALMASGSDSTAPASPLPAGILSGPTTQTQGWVTRQTWTLDAQALERHARNVLGHHQNSLRNLYIVLRKRSRFTLTAQPTPETYRLRVVSRSEYKLDNPFNNIEGDSNVLNPIVLQRWCTQTSFENQTINKMEKSSDTFALSERLSHGDADYFLIWLQEGEHLNVTYRGEIPAILDAGGAGRELDEGMEPHEPYQWESVLNYIWDTWLADPNKMHQDPATLDADLKWGGAVAHLPNPTYNALLVTGWRPALWPSSGSRALCDSFLTPLCKDQFFAQRGYLWSHNEELGISNSVPMTDDNAVHLTLTAYVTGPYIIRVRGQGNEKPEPEGNLPGVYTQRYRDTLALGTGNGHPYTSNVGLGVYPNRLRPHWQHLDPGENPARSLACQR